MFQKLARGVMRCLVRYFDAAVLGPPPKDLKHDGRKDFLMALHRCPQCRHIGWDRAYDFVSRNEHVFCGLCGTKQNLRHAAGITLFYLRECVRIAWPEEAHKQLSTLMGFCRCLKLLAFGIPDEKLPADRGGKTAGELEYEAWVSLIATFAYDATPH